MIFTHSSMNPKDSAFFVQVLGGPRKVGGQKENNVIIRHQTLSDIRFDNEHYGQDQCEEELNPGAPSPFLIIANKISKGPVILNVGGKRHEVVMMIVRMFMVNMTKCLIIIIIIVKD